MDDSPAPLALDRPADAGPAHCVSWRLTLSSIVGFWLLYFLVNSSRAAIERDTDLQLIMMERRLLVVATGITLTCLLALILQRLENRSLGTLIATAFGAAVPLSLAYAGANFMAFEYFPLRSMSEDLDWHGTGISPAAEIIVGTGLSWYFFIVAWAVLYVALVYGGRVRRAERSAALYRAEAQAAQLRALRYQINPHFLFNTLNSLSSLILSQRTHDAERMVINLATFFRTSLAADPTEDVALADEITLQRLYLDIEQIRFAERLRVSIELPAALETVRVPGLILQPLIENAVKHGVARSLRPVTIRIAAATAHGRLELSVEDDGDAADGAAAPGCGLGLRNVRERLAARFGDAATCRYGPAPDGGFAVRLTLPLDGEAVPPP